MPDYLVGSDVGTGGTKSVVIDTEGNVLGQHFIEYPLKTNNKGYAEHDPQWYWDAVADTILVAAGTYSGSHTVPVQQWEGVYTYTQVVIITKSLTLQGGYTPADWYNPDPTVNTTIIDAQRHGRGVSIVGNWNDHPLVTIDGFTIKGGDYTGLGNPDGVSNQVCASTGSTMLIGQ